MFNIGSMAFKLTLLFLYLRLFKPMRWAIWLIWAGIATVAVVYIVISILLLDKCTPKRNETWQYTTYFGSCTPTQEDISFTTGIFGVISDIYTLCIPLWLVSHLRLAPKRKIGVLAVFGTGLL